MAQFSVQYGHPAELPVFFRKRKAIWKPCDDHLLSSPRSFPFQYRLVFLEQAV